MSVDYCAIFASGGTGNRGDPPFKMQDLSINRSSFQDLGDAQLQNRIRLARSRRFSRL
ncbi:hypothetical protein KL86PLE_41102 [uncultured Pleomorphomonas sp.]|uniref:Uncharacterized protein n=1 Tax=uncultured Pleomorphomonas sp. TaxID=442121 RepID=A0A212LIJ0_9HYPH|nr:hypothetical protein KL86PLE_41102 [uncultured Pleomorphomonas sp.]